jgi:DNA-binding transcriptional ArsR family regulator
MVVDDLAAEELDELFRALADPTRRDILRRCVDGEPSVSRLAQAYPMSFAAVQKHVAVLARAGLVTKERRGRFELTERDGGTRMEMQSAFESREDMEKVVSTGTVEGLQQAVSQMDGVLDA